MSYRVSNKELGSLVARINQICGFPETAGSYDTDTNSVVIGYSIYSTNPGHAATRYQLHFYNGFGTSVRDDCIWSFSLGSSEFAGKLRAFAAGLTAPKGNYTPTYTPTASPGSLNNDTL